MAPTDTQPDTTTAPELATELPAIPAPAPQRIRVAVSPEIAANLREEDEALAATIATAQALAQGVVNNAQAMIEVARAKRQAALRPILRQLLVDAAEVIGVEGFGADTRLVLDIPTEAVPDA